MREEREPVNRSWLNLYLERETSTKDHGGGVKTVEEGRIFAHESPDDHLDKWNVPG